MLGISVDSAPCNAAWAKSLGGISFDLLSDFEPKGEVARRYGIYRREGYTERALFLVDRRGRIIYKDIHAIDQPPDIEDIFAALRKAA